MLDNLPPIDIASFLSTAVLLAFVFAGLVFFNGLRTIRDARDMKFVRVRRQRLVAGWRMLFGGIILLFIGFMLRLWGEPVAYRFIEVTSTVAASPTITISPTVTVSPTITLTPSITPTLSESLTPTATATPHLPIAVQAQFTSEVTPSPDSVFSPLVFSQGLDANFQPIRPGIVFANPVGHMYGSFSYDGMLDGVQWTALWYRDGQLVYYETIPWDGGTGGLGFTDWEPAPDEWLPGNYQVQIFVGEEVKVVGDFAVTGDAATSTPAASPTVPATPSPSPTETNTPGPTNTGTPRPPTQTPYPTLTRTPVTPSITPWPTLTRTPTPTPN